MTQGAFRRATIAHTGNPPSAPELGHAVASPPRLKVRLFYGTLIGALGLTTALAAGCQGPSGAQDSAASTVEKASGQSSITGDGVLWLRELVNTNDIDGGPTTSQTFCGWDINNGARNYFNKTQKVQFCQDHTQWSNDCNFYYGNKYATLDKSYENYVYRIKPDSGDHTGAVINNDASPIPFYFQIEPSQKCQAACKKTSFGVAKCDSSGSLSPPSPGGGSKVVCTDLMSSDANSWSAHSMQYTMWSNPVPYWCDDKNYLHICANRTDWKMFNIADPNAMVDYNNYFPNSQPPQCGMTSTSQSPTLINLMSNPGDVGAFTIAVASCTPGQMYCGNDSTVVSTTPLGGHDHDLFMCAYNTSHALELRHIQNCPSNSPCTSPTSTQSDAFCGNVAPTGAYGGDNEVVSTPCIPGGLYCGSALMNLSSGSAKPRMLYVCRHDASHLHVIDDCGDPSGANSKCSVNTDPNSADYCTPNTLN